MELTEEILLPALLAAIVANTVILLLVIVAARRRDGVGPAATRSVLQGSMMSTSYIDRSPALPWTSNGEEAAGTKGSDGPDEGDAADGVDAVDAPSAPAAAAEPDIDEVGSNGPEAWLEAEPELASRADLELAPREDPEAEPRTDSEVGPHAEPEVAQADPGPGAAPSGTDPLTGLLDSATFTRLVAAEDLRVHRYHRPATVVVFELGGLDRLIARLGPDAADRVVPALADTMRRLARNVDHVARLAPARFGVLLPETDEVATINYVERVRRACELWLESGAIALTLAAGWAGTDGDPTLVEAQRLATERMYVELRRDARRAGER